MISVQACAEEDYRFAYQMLVSSYAQNLQDEYTDVVFFGDSLTRECLWEDVYPDYLVMNLGCYGDTIECLNMRIPLLEAINARKVFIMIGINDLFRNHDDAQIDQDVHLLFEKLSNINADIYIQSTLPIRDAEGQDVGKANNIRVCKLNSLFQELCAEHEFTYISMFNKFLDDENQLAAEYTRDGIHLTLDGYYLWFSEIESYVYE